MTIALLIVDDHETVREGVRYALGGDEIETAEAPDGETALAMVFNQRVDIVLLDVDMPDLNGLDVLNQIKQQRPDLPVLMHSCHDRIAYVERSCKLGAAGYLVKSPNSTKVIEAIHVALAGGTLWTPEQIQHAKDCGDFQA